MPKHDISVEVGTMERLEVSELENGVEHPACYLFLLTFKIMKFK